MKRKTLIGAALLVAALAGIAITVSVRREHARTQATEAEAARRAAADAPIEFSATELMSVGPVDLVRSVPITGSLRPVEQAVVRSKTAGEVRELSVREGMAVRRGQQVARIDPTDAEQRLREREAQLASAEAQVAQARRDLDNNRALAGRGFIAQAALDRSVSSLEVTEAARDAVRAQIAQARKGLADTAVVSPISGIVSERLVQPGEKVSPDARLLVIVDLSRMEIEAPVPASEIAAVAVGRPVRLRIEGIEQPVEGRIARIAPGTAANSRSVPVWIAVDNEDPRVRAGMFAQGLLAVETRRGVLAVPATALRDRAGRAFVYALADGRVVERDVRTGLRDDGGTRPMVEVLAGLAAGERVVAVNLGTLRAGAPAVVREAQAGDRER